MSAPCWRFRYEALGFEGTHQVLDAWSVEEIDALVLATGRTLEPDALGWMPQRMEVFEDMCDLDEGHGGPCRFVPQDEIVLVFPAVAS